MSRRENWKSLNLWPGEQGCMDSQHLTFLAQWFLSGPAIRAETSSTSAGVDSQHLGRVTAAVALDEESTSLGAKLHAIGGLFCLILFFLLMLFLSLFLLREKEQGRGRERERQRIPSRLHAASTEPNMCSNAQTVRS